MKKFAILITSVLLFASVVCIVPASESDGAVITNEDALVYDVYRIDLAPHQEPEIHSYYNVTLLRYYTDQTSISQFMDALDNKTAIPESDHVARWNGQLTTVFVFGHILYSNNYDGIVFTNLSVYDGTKTIYMTEENRIKKASNHFYLLSGQTVKIDIPDNSGEYRFMQAGAYDYYDGSNMQAGENEIKISARGNHFFFQTDGTFTPYLSYTIEYETTPTNTSAYGYVFLAIGVIFLAALIFFALPQKIKD